MSASAKTAPATGMISRRNLVLAAGAAALAGGGGAWVLRRRAASFDGAALDPVQAHRQALSGAIYLIDIRRPDEWRRTGIGEGAHPIDMRRDDFTAALDAVTGGDKDAPVAVICARGVRSGRLSNRLTGAGYTNIINIPEGMLGSGAGPGWLARGVPVVAFEG